MQFVVAREPFDLQQHNASSYLCHGGQVLCWKLQTAKPAAAPVLPAVKQVLAQSADSSAHRAAVPGTAE
jgi:hypothetical protein